MRGGYGSSPEKKHRIPDLAAQGADQFPHLGTGVKTVVLHLHQP